MDKQSQLRDLDQAFAGFVSLVSSVTPGQFLHSLGGWTPRDVTAHLIGWNRNIRLGCAGILRGEAPFYHADGTNDYRSINAGFVQEYNSMNRDELLGELEASRRELRLFLDLVSEADWTRDFGPQHYRGGPATVGRAAASLTNDYVDHTRQIRESLSTIT